jgi:hypothetical protein
MPIDIQSARERAWQVLLEGGYEFVGETFGTATVEWPALDALVELERCAAVDEWCRDPKSEELAEARLEAAIAAIMGGEHE